MASNTFKIRVHNVAEGVAVAELTVTEAEYAFLQRVSVALDGNTNESRLREEFAPNLYVEKVAG